MHRTLEWWDKWFLGLAKYISTASKDPSTQVGCVIIDSNRRIVSTGYNGFAVGIHDDERLSGDSKLGLAIHSECNAILFAKRDLVGCSLYVWPFMPCSNCASFIIQSGIKRVISVECDPNRKERWKSSFDLAIDAFRESGVEMVLYEDII